MWTSQGLNLGPPDYETDRMIFHDILFEWKYIEYQSFIQERHFVLSHRIPMTQIVCLRIVYAEQIDYWGLWQSTTIVM